MAIPIFAFTFFFILCAIYLAKKMKLISENAADRKGYSELEQANTVLGGGVFDMMRSFNQEYLQYGHTPVSLFAGIVASFGTFWKEKLVGNSDNKQEPKESEPKKDKKDKKTKKVKVSDDPVSNPSGAKGNEPKISLLSEDQQMQLEHAMYSIQIDGASNDTKKEEFKTEDDESHPEATYQNPETE